MIGDAEARPGERRQQPELVDELADVAGDARHLGGALGIAAVAGEQMAVVLDHGAAARRGDEDGVEPAFAERARPGIDIAPRGLVRLVLAAELMLERAAAGLVLGITTSTPWRLSSRIAARLMEGSSTSCTQPSISATRLTGAPAGRTSDLRFGVLRGGRRDGTSASAAAPVFMPSCREAGRGRAAPASRTARRCGSALGWAASWRSSQRVVRLRRRALVLDADAGEVDEMHVVDAARAGGHAGEAGEAAVDVIADRRGHLALLEHLLDQIDAAARGIALVAEQHIGRAGGGAEAAMDAAPQHGVGAGDGRVLELLVGEIGVHG